MVDVDLLLDAVAARVAERLRPGASGRSRQSAAPRNLPRSRRAQTSRRAISERHPIRMMLPRGHLARLLA